MVGLMKTKKENSNAETLKSLVWRTGSLLQIACSSTLALSDLTIFQTTFLRQDTGLIALNPLELPAISILFQPFWHLFLEHYQIR